MLPTNPQSLTASDRAVLENLKQQGTQIDHQTKVLETLVDKVTRQMRSDERLEKSSKKEKNAVKGDTKLNDIPGTLFDKFSDQLNESISKSFNSIRDKFKEDKAKPADKTKESAVKDKDKQSKDDKDVLKSILNTMVSSSKYQEQMLEHTKAIQAIADKTYVGITDLKNNLQNPDQPLDEIAPTIDKPADKPKKDTKKSKSDTEKLKTASNDNVFSAANDTAFDEEKLSDSIGVAVGKALKPQMDVLGKRLKDGFDDLAYAISDIDTGTSIPAILPGAAGAGAATTAAEVGAATTAAATAGSVAAGVMTGAGVIGAGLTVGATNALSNATDEQLGMLSADIGSDTGIASAALLEARQPKPKEEQASVRKIDNKLANAEAERNAADKKLGGRYAEGKLERRADKIKPEYLKWAQKFYNDPNLQDPDYLSLPENKNILNLLEERQNLNMKPEAEKVKPRQNKTSSLMKEVTDEKTELASSGDKSGAPIVINNTNNNMSGQGSNMTFAAATSQNPSRAINDYFRNGAKFYDAVA
jgi:hypothetical protein